MKITKQQSKELRNASEAFIDYVKTVGGTGAIVVTVWESEEETRIHTTMGSTICSVSPYQLLTVAGSLINMALDSTPKTTNIDVSLVIDGEDFLKNK